MHILNASARVVKEGLAQIPREGLLRLKNRMDLKLPILLDGGVRK